MQAVVKMHHIKIEAPQIPSELINFLKRKYGTVQIINNEDELIEAQKSTWYQKIKKNLSPSKNMKLYRELHGLTQEELSQKLGGIGRHNISNMERGKRAISKESAKNLARIFKTSVEKFI